MQRLLEVAARGLDRALDRRLVLGFLALLRTLPRHLEPGLARQLLDRVEESQIGVLHGEADDIAMRAAAEAVIELLILDDAERRRLLFVEGTEADIFPTAANEPNAATDDPGKRYALAQLVEKPGRKCHVR